MTQSGNAPGNEVENSKKRQLCTACTLALSPIRDTHSEGFSQFVASLAAPVASGWNSCRVGLAPTGKRRLVTAHTPSSQLFRLREENFDIAPFTQALILKTSRDRLGHWSECLPARL